MIDVCPFALGLCVITFNVTFCTCNPSTWDPKMGGVEEGRVGGERRERG